MLKPQEEEQDTRRWSVEKDKKNFFFFFKDPGIPEARGAGACARPRTLGPGLIDRRSYLLIPLSLFLVGINIFSLFLFFGMYVC